MSSIEWNGGYIRVPPPKKPKKITGTHFPTVLGVSPYATPFVAWCRCTRTYERPFEGNKYTDAGQIIEPKVLDFLRSSMGFGNRLVTPTDKYGEDYFKKMWGDFYHDNPIFGGMWDALIVGDNCNPEYVVEIKTVQVDGKSGTLEERWRNGEAPHYQALQASLYAYLLGIDRVMMVGVTLENKKGDYEHPELVVPSFANGNVYIDEFEISKRYPNFDLYIAEAAEWWRTYVLTGTSPIYDERKDADMIAALRTNTVEPSDDITALIAEAERLKDEVDRAAAAISDVSKRLKSIQEQIGQYAMAQFRDGDRRVSVRGQHYEWVLSRLDSTELDRDALATAGLLEQYTKSKTNYRLTVKQI